MKLADIETDVRPLALKFARELAGVLHKHFTARVDAARKVAVAKLREDMETDDGDDEQRSLPRKGPRRAVPAKVPARIGAKASARPRGEAARAVDSKGDRARAAVPAPARKVTVTCSTCGEAGHNKRGCPKSKEAAPAPSPERLPAERAPREVRRELIAQRDIKPDNMPPPIAPALRPAPPPSKLNRFARIEAAARARAEAEQ